MILRATLLLAALAPFALRAQSATSVAGLSQDVASLRDEVRKLREEVDELRAAQATLAKNAAAKPAGADKSAVDTRFAAVESASAGKASKTDLAALDAKIDRMAANVEKALAEQTRQVNAALQTKPAAVATAAPKPVDKPAPPPSDMPKTGVRYTVHAGDSVPRIAKKLNSKAAWILAANGMKSNADLKAESVIFVPQTEEAKSAE